MMEGTLKNLVNLDNTVEVPRKKSRLDIDVCISSRTYYQEGKKYILNNKDRKPPPSKNDEFEWIWWEGKWIRMFNDVFLPKETIIPKIIKLAKCNYI